MNIKALREKKPEELKKQLEELHAEMMKDRAAISAGTPPENPGMMKERRRTIARILTLINEKEVKH